MLKEEQKNEVIALCQKLVSIPSYSGEEEQVGIALKEFFEQHNYDEVRIDSYGNVIGVIKGNRPGKKLLFDGHIDTVPVVNEEKWTHSPFEADSRW